MVTRTWACLNRHCRLVFDEQLDNPPCPKCGGIRTKWQPRPFGILSASTKFGTRTAEKLAQDYGLTNFHTPEFGRPAIMHESPIRNNQALNIHEAMKAREIGEAQERAAAGAISARASEARASAGGIDYVAPGMPNWKAKIPVDDQGRMMAACLPTGVTAKLSANVAQSGDRVEIAGGRAATSADLSGATSGKQT